MSAMRLNIKVKTSVTKLKSLFKEREHLRLAIKAKFSIVLSLRETCKAN